MATTTSRAKAAATKATEEKPDETTADTAAETTAAEETSGDTAAAEDVATEEPAASTEDHPEVASADETDSQDAQSAPRVPRVGDRVLYTVSDDQANHANDLRAKAHRSLGFHRENGTHLHEGNTVHPGDTFAMDIVRVFDADPTPDSVINGQVLLDGNDTLWVTSVGQAVGQPGCWTWLDS